MTIEEITNLMTIAHQAALTNQHDSRHPELKAAHEALHQYATERDATMARLRKALERNRQGYQNILEFRKIGGGSDRYGALSRGEIKTVIAEIHAALADTPQSKQDGTA